MAFDRTSQADLLALKTEVNTDPLSMGYLDSGNTQKLLGLLNDPDANVGGETVGSAFTPELFLKVVVPGDLTVGGQFSQGELEFLKLLFEASFEKTDNLDAFRAKVRDLFPAQSGTVAALDAEVSLISRAEVLFGQGTNIDRLDWIAARDS